jgi:SAM-dependent MidA family methyltransferase
MENQKIEIAEICVELENLSRSDFHTTRTAIACTQAASLLKEMRAMIIGSELTDTLTIEKLKRILAEQGEG